MLTKESKILIKNVWESKKYGVSRLIKEFFKQEVEQAWCGDFLKRLRSTRSIERAPCSGRCEPRPIDEWRRRLSACVDAEGRHFEHYL